MFRQEIHFSSLSLSELRPTVPDQHQAGLVGGLAIVQLEGVGALVGRLQGLHDHLDHACVLVKVHLVLLRGGKRRDNT